MGLKSDFVNKTKAIKGVQNFVRQNNNYDAPMLERKRGISDDELTDAFNNCKSAGEIAERLDISISYVYSRLSALGFRYPLGRRKNRTSSIVTDADRENLIKEYRGTVRANELATKYGMRPQVLSEVLHVAIKKRIDSSDLSLAYPKNIWQVKIANEILYNPLLFTEPDTGIESLARLTNMQPYTISAYFKECEENDR